MSATLDLHVDTRGSGFPLVLSHGVGADVGVWQGLVDRLSGSYQVVRYDQPGHGSSPQLGDPSEYGAAVAYRALSQVADGFARLALIGHSLGGYLSTRYAIDHPGRVAALVLVSTGPGFRAAEAREKWNTDTRANAERQGRPETLVGLHEDSYVMDHLTEIACPTLVVVGSLDKAFLGSSDYLQKKVPTCERVTVDGAGHDLPSSHGARLGELVADFLTRHGVV